MQKKRWSELSPRVRRGIVIGATIEAVLKIAALADLARRPASEINGPKVRWATAIVLVNSMGIVPVAYFRYGRRNT